MSTKPRRLPKRWIVVSIILVALAILPIGLKLWVNAIEARRWEEMRVQLEDLVRNARERDGTRPVLRGQPQPGNAWEDYEAGFRTLPYEAIKPTWEFLYGSPPGDRAKARAAVQLYAPALQALQRGVRRANGQHPIEWEQSPHVPNTGVQLLGHLAICEARFLRETGQVRQAADLLLDAAQLGADAIRNGVLIDAMFGLAVLGNAFDELRDLVVSSAMNPDDLSEVAAELGVLHRSFPRLGDVWVNDTIVMGFAMLNSGNLESCFKSAQSQSRKISTYRYGFSERIMMVDAFQAELAITRRLGEATERSWTEAQDIQERVFADQDAEPNPLFREGRIIAQKLKGSGRPRDAFRERQAQLRLLRIAAHFRATGEILSLDDPFGGLILSSIVENRKRSAERGGRIASVAGIGQAGCWGRGDVPVSGSASARSAWQA
jgi:hypothetical protein